MSGNKDQGRAEVHEARLTALTMFSSPEIRPQDESLDPSGQEIRVEVSSFAKICFRARPRHPWTPKSAVNVS